MMAQFRSGHRLALLFAACLALFFSLVLSGPLVAQAHSLSDLNQLSTGPHGKQIDFAHPVRVEVVHSHSGHAQALPPNTVPFYMPPQTGLAVPQANFPSGCLNGYGYYVVVRGRTSWTAQTGNQKAQVWYMWCPRWSGDSLGMNWSFGKIYQLSGCANISVGGPFPDEVGGAFILEQASWPNWVDDGEPVTTYRTCAGGGYVWDDSLTVPGNGLYMVEMADNIVSVLSPCYC